MFLNTLPYSKCFFVWDDRYKKEAGENALSGFFALTKIFNIYILNWQSFTDQTLNLFDIFTGSIQCSISIHLFYWDYSSCTDVVEPWGWLPFMISAV